MHLQGRLGEAGDEETVSRGHSRRPVGTQDEPEKLLGHVARFSVIHTDRTHGAIAGALMGREVHLYPNAYFKNRAIYEHSLHHFPHVSFESPPVDWPDRIRESAFTAYQAVRSIDRRLRSVTGMFPPENPQ